MEQTKSLNEAKVNIGNNKPYNKGLIIAIFLIGCFVTVLNQTVLITALPQIMKSFNITVDTAQWLTTAYMMMNGILIPVTAFLISRYTTRQLFITALSLFILGTVIAALSNNFSTLLIARIIQACGAGITMPLMQTVIFAMYPKEKRGSAMGLVGLVIGFAPAIGPTVSGIIVDNFTWRYIFSLVIPIAIIVLILTIIFMKNVSEVNKKEKLDLLSVIFSTIGFGSLLYATSFIGDGENSIKAVSLIAIGIIFILLLVVRGSKLEKPMLEFKVFKSSIFTLTLILAVISYFGLMGVETVLPIYLQNLRQMSAFHSGLTLLPGAIVMGAVSMIAGKAYDKIGAKYLSVVGFFIIAITTIPFVMLKIDTPIVNLVVFYALRLVGISMIMMTLTTEGLNSLAPKLINHGNAMSSTIRQVGGSIGTALVVAIYTNATKNALKSGDITNPAMAQVHGMSYAFIFVTILAVIGFLISFKLKGKKRA